MSTQRQKGIIIIIVGVILAFIFPSIGWSLARSLGSRAILDVFIYGRFLVLLASIIWGVKLIITKENVLKKEDITEPIYNSNSLPQSSSNKNVFSNLFDLSARLPSDLSNDIDHMYLAVRLLEDRMTCMTEEMNRLSAALERIPEGLSSEELQEFMDAYVAQLDAISSRMEKLDVLVNNLEAMNDNLDGNQQAVEGLTQLLEDALGDYMPRDSD